MKARTDDHLAGLIARYATEPAIRRQLERLPAFDVPVDSETMFRDLLARLDRPAASGREGSSPASSA